MPTVGLFFNDLITLRDQVGLLPPRDAKRLRQHLKRIPLEYRQSLYRTHKPIGFVYFIETGVGSLVSTMANGETAEVGTIGNEGMVGLPILLGDDRAPIASQACGFPNEASGSCARSSAPSGAPSRH